MVNEYPPAFSQKKLVIEEGFFRSPACKWLRGQKYGCEALSVYLYLFFKCGGITDGAFLSGVGDEPDNWVPVTAEEVQKDFPCMTVDEVEYAFQLLRQCEALRWCEDNPGVTETFMYSPRNDVYLTFEAVRDGKEGEPPERHVADERDSQWKRRLLKQIGDEDYKNYIDFCKTHNLPENG